MIEMRADGDITKEKLLDSLPGLVEEYIRELPYLMAGREKVVCDHTYTDEHEECKRKVREEGHLPMISPEMFRERAGGGGGTDPRRRVQEERALP